MDRTLSQLEQITNAISTARQTQDDVTPETVSILTRALIDSFENEAEFECLEQEYASDPAFGDLQLDITMAIVALQYGDADWFIPKLIRYLNTDPQLHELAEAVLTLSFPKTHDSIPDHSCLTPIQQNALDAIIANEFVWKSNSQFGNQLAKRGLPPNRQDLVKLRENNAG